MRRLSDDGLVTQPLDQPSAQPFIALALRRDLRELHREVVAAREVNELAGGAYVPTQLARSLHMFLDSSDLGGAPPAKEE